MPRTIKFPHKNRVENSFTARLFEGIRFPKFTSDPVSYSVFVKFLNEKGIENRKLIKSKYQKTPYPDTWMNEKLDLS